ncbi:MAG: serine acetyltransferase, partial [Pseudopedobacter saltans]
MNWNKNDKKDFYEHLLKKQNEVMEMPSNKRIATWALHILEILFPEQKSNEYNSVEDIASALRLLEVELENIMRQSKVCDCCPHKKVASNFFLPAYPKYQN